MKPNPQEYAQALYDQLLDTPVKRQSKLVQKLVDSVRQHGQMKAADKIIAAFSEIVERKNHSLRLHLISAQPLHNLLKLSAKITSAFNQDIEIRNYVNPELIGGIIIRYRNYKIDLSVKSHIQKARANQGNQEELPSQLIQIIEIITQNRDLLFAKEDPVQDKKIEIVELSSVQPIKLAPLEKVFSARLRQKVIIHYNQDPELIGGAVIKYDSHKIDSSIDQALDEIQEKKL